jgi:hypothetical protein
MKVNIRRWCDLVSMILRWRPGRRVHAPDTHNRFIVFRSGPRPGFVSPFVRQIRMPDGTYVSLLREDVFRRSLAAADLELRKQMDLVVRDERKRASEAVAGRHAQS